jgi:hypothetical protein
MRPPPRAKRVSGWSAITTDALARDYPFIGTSPDRSTEHSPDH